MKTIIHCNKLLETVGFIDDTNCKILSYDKDRKIRVVLNTYDSLIQFSIIPLPKKNFGQSHIQMSNELTTQDIKTAIHSLINNESGDGGFSELIESFKKLNFIKLDWNTLINDSFLEYKIKVEINCHTLTWKIVFYDELDHENHEFVNCSIGMHGGQYFEKHFTEMVTRIIHHKIK